MSDAAFSTGLGFTPIGIPGRSSNTSGNVGLAGSALLPTLTAELRSEFYPLLATLANNGSAISSTYIMELFFTLVRFDAILHADERHLFVSTSQQLITKQLKQLQTVHHKVKLLEENLTFVDELMERCAALEVLCGSRADAEGEEGAEEGEENEEIDATAATTTAPDIGTATEDDEGGEAGNTTNDEDAVTATNNNASNYTLTRAAGEEGDAGEAPTYPGSLQQQQQQAVEAAQRSRRVTPSPGVRSALRARNYSFFSSTGRSTASSPHRARYFSFDEDVDDLINRSHEAPVPSPALQQSHHRRGADRRAPSVARSATGNPNNESSAFTVTSSTGPLRQRHLQRPPPLPLNLVNDNTTTASAATPASAATAVTDTANASGQRSANVSRPRTTSRHRKTSQGAAEPLLMDRRASDSSIVGAEDAGGTAEGDVVGGAGLDGSASASANVTPAVFTGVQHALQEHFRQNVKKTLTGATRAAPMSALETPHLLSRSPRSVNTTSAGDCFTAPGQTESGAGPAAAGGDSVSDAEKEKNATVAVPSLQQSQQQQQQGAAELARRSFSVSQLSTMSNNNNNNNNSSSAGPSTGLAAAAASANHINILSTDGGGPLAVSPLAGAPYSANPYSPTDLDPVDTARVWDRMFWGFLDGRTATADLVVLLSLLNDGNAALQALQANEARSGKRAGSESTATNTTTTTGSGPHNTNNNAAANGASNTGKSGGKAGGGHSLASATRLGGMSLDTIARSPPVTATPTPDCGALPLMEALKRTGSYAELLPAPAMSNMSFASAAAAAAANAVAMVGDDSTYSRIRRDRAGDVTEDEDASARPASGTTSNAALFPAVTGNSTTNVGAPARAAGGSGQVQTNNTTLNSVSIPDDAPLRAPPLLPRQWANLDDYAKAEEARLHRDFWAHIPAILVTLSEGLMYGDSHRRANGGGSGGSAAATPHTGSRDDKQKGGGSRSRRRRGSSAVTVAAAAEAGGEVADAPNNASALYEGGALGDSHRTDGETEDDEAGWGSTNNTRNATSHDGAAAGPARDTDIGEDTANEDDNDDESGHDNREAETFVPLHPPSAEALQLLPTFSPLLRNYATAMGKLTQVAPDYARSTQAQHARALATAAAAAQQQQQQLQLQLQQQQLCTPSLADPSTASGFTSESEVGDTNAATETAGMGRGLTRAATHHSSVNDFQEWNEMSQYNYYATSADRRGPMRLGNASGALGRTSRQQHASPLPAASAAAAAAAAATTANAATASASPETADLGLLGDGSSTEVRPVDVVMYALVTAVYVQCAMPIEHQQRMQLFAGNAAGQHRAHHMNGESGVVGGADGRHTALPQALAVDGKASPSESGRSPAGGFSPQVGLGWPGSSGAGAADGVGEEDRALNLSLANGSLSYAANTAPGSFGFSSSAGWWNATAAGSNLNNNMSVGSNVHRGHYMTNSSFGGAAPHMLRSLQPHLAHTYGGTSRFDNTLFTTNASFSTPQHNVGNFSFEFSGGSPTDAALAFLRTAHEEKANGGSCDRAKEVETKAEGSTFVSIPHAAPLAMVFPTQDVLACANEFSWVSLPSLMSAELQNLKAQLQATRDAVRRMENQVRGELALLLFRVLSLVLDWLMPAVYVADPRIWLFYRKWCCDLYRVLCTDLALLDEFRRLLNQSGVAVIAAAPGSENSMPSTATVAAAAAGAAQRARNRRETSAPTAMSATATPTYKPLRSDGHARTPPRPAPQPGTPVLTGHYTGGGSGSAGRSGSAPLVEEHRPKGVISPFPAAAAADAEERHLSDDNGDNDDSSSAEAEGDVTHTHRDKAKAAEEREDVDLFSYILPGSSLVVSVAHATPPVQPGVLTLLAQEEADRRGEALADSASLRAAQALLSDEGKVIPLPRPFLITRLVAATLRGIDADIAESLLWVVGQATDPSHGSTTSDVNTTITAAPPALQRAATDDPSLYLQANAAAAAAAMTALQQGDPLQGSLNNAGSSTMTNNNNNSSLSVSGHGAAADNVHSTAQWKSQRPRHGSRSASGHRLLAGHSPQPAGVSNSSGSTGSNLSRRRRSDAGGGAGLRRDSAAAAGGVGGSPRFEDDYYYGEEEEEDDDDEDSDEGQELARRYGGGGPAGNNRNAANAGRGTRRRFPPAPAQSPVMAGPPGSSANFNSNAGGGMSSHPSTSMFPVMTPHTPYADLSISTAGMQQGQLHQQQQQQQSAQVTVVPEGPMLVHHHRFRYPSVSGFADVAQLYLSTLEDAELLLSPHDPVYASLVLSTADVHLHDLRDRETAAMLINSYLADVGEEQIQAPIWDVLPTALMPMDGLNAATSSNNTNNGSSGAAGASSSPTPGRGFSVTRVRQGNTGIGANLSFAAAPTTLAPASGGVGSGGGGGGNTASAAIGGVSSSGGVATATGSVPQQPYVPMVIPSWNNEREKNEFLGTLRILRQIQLFLTEPL